jgi:hypothetical protein
MAYYSGSAADMSALRSALVSACTSEGWSWDSSSEMLSKDTLFLRLQVSSGFLRLRGRTSATEGDAPMDVQMGPFTSRQNPQFPAFVYPLDYELFIFDSEVYCVIKYSLDVFQFCAFGQSSISLPGTGLWLSASGWGNSAQYYSGLVLGVEGAASSLSFVCPAPFWRNGGSSGQNESWVHSNCDNQGWWWGQTSSSMPLGASALSPLMKIQPSSWNSEAVLLPIRAYKVRADNKQSLIVDLAHARYLRIDYYSPQQLIVLGEERWRVFPFYQKNTSVRDGGANHSGTLGWAIRYEGA